MPELKSICPYCKSTNVKPRIVMRAVYFDCADCGVSSHRLNMTEEYNRLKFGHARDVLQQVTEGK